MLYRFDTFTLDLSLGQLSRDGEEVAVEPRAFALLCYLVENRGRLVTKDELVEHIWDGRFITDTAISTLIKTARRALDDDGKAQRLIRTVHGRGFRFAGIVEEVVPAEARHELARDPAPDGAAQEAGAQPSIAVLPFRRIGQTETYGAIADAVPSELISSLSRLRWLKVVARGSTFRFRDQTPDADAIRTMLGATYCLTGEVEVFGSDLALTVELGWAMNGRRACARRFARTR
jgi:DNA-binding winged helix-turn-helix (wHTH) protein